MAYTTVEKDGEPWMLCHSVNDSHLDEKIAAMQGDAPSANLTHRPSAPVESQRCAEAMDAQPGLTEDPFKFFAVKITDLPS